MHIYEVSPELFRKKGGFDDEFDDWLYGCFRSKWDDHEPIDDDMFPCDEPNFKEFEPEILKGD